MSNHNFARLTRNERHCILTIAVILLLTICIFHFVGRSDDNTVFSGADSINMPTKKRLTTENKSYYTTPDGNTDIKTTPVKFDPNTADSTLLLSLGLKPWQVRNIYRYRAKGGVFSHKSDFARVYGLTAGQYRRLEPYINIGDDFRPAAEVYTTQPTERHYADNGRHVGTNMPHRQKLKAGEHISLNTADTTRLTLVPGIGPYFARAITAYRNRLGGFYSTRQLTEIEGFPAESLPYFNVDDSPRRLIEVNKATLSQLRRHPYITFHMARAITEHRRLHGHISSIGELRTYPDFTPEAIERLKHYLDFR